MLFITVVEMVILMEQEKYFQKIENVLCQLIIHFVKKPTDVRNGVETRAQLSLKTKLTRQQFCRYMRCVHVFSRDSFISDDYSDSDDDSLTNNASNTEKDLYLDDETEKTTGENLIIDENVDTVETNSISDTQNPDNKEGTKNKILP